MSVTSKVRLYDLAKELKQDTKRLIEEVRREGVDVSVPSNSVSKELADKIRNRYFPKKETTVPRRVVVVKKARPTVVEEEPVVEESVVEAAPQQAEIAETAPHAPIEQPDAARPSVVRQIRRLTPATRAEHPAATAEATAPAAEPVQQEEEAQPIEYASVEIASMPEAVAAAPDEQMMEAPPAAPPAGVAAPQPFVPSRQVRVLRPTAAALTAGVKVGERAPAPMPPPPLVSPRERRERQERAGQTNERSNERPDRGGERNTARAPVARADRAGTPGETATPQITYIPSPSDGRGRRPGRGGRNTTRGGKSNEGGRGGRFDRDFIAPPKALSLEDRIAGRLSMDVATIAGELKTVRIIEGSTVKEFAEKLNIKPKDIVTLLLQRGVFATINQPLNDDVAIDLAHRFGYEVTFVPFEEMVAEEEFEDLIATDTDDVELPRAPVVTIMGHVDHGKTSLLDAIRTTDVAAGEAGGITQHIGAYSVQVPSSDNPAETRRVVFLDTPGHEAFTMMRARGAKATDVVVLVVAADDGVMPQTIEAVEHSRAAGVPIIVAINKIDRPDANPDRVKQGLANLGLQPVEWGGETEMVQVSAKKRENLDTLLETILLTTDILDLKASPTRLASGVVLEAKLDRGRGSVATVLVQQGTLRAHDPFIVGQIFGKVRAMFDDRGNAITEAGPATPVEVLGLQGVPQAGESFQVVADITKAQSISAHRQMLTRQNTLLQSTKRGIEALGETEIKELLVVIKADVQGSVEVLRSTLQKLSTETIKVKVIRSGVGAITESDVLLASATQAGASSTAVVIIGFN
ncbi:MAG: translation initiation factor IF-2, partial [Acidobacteria bacterium]|nr:translation initiation factor IF-2 [Acidobacteriota bacterium]